MNIILEKRNQISRTEDKRRDWSKIRHREERETRSEDRKNIRENVWFGKEWSTGNVDDKGE